MTSCTIISTYMLHTNLERIISTDTGLVEIEASEQLVKLDSTVHVHCISSQEEESVKEWQHATPKKENMITNGTESIITSHGKRTNLTLKSISRIWAGVCVCQFLQFHPNDPKT